MLRVASFWKNYKFLAQQILTPIKVIREKNIAIVMWIRIVLLRWYKYLLHDFFRYLHLFISNLISISFETLIRQFMLWYVLALLEVFLTYRLTVHRFCFKHLIKYPLCSLSIFYIVCLIIMLYFLDLITKLMAR